MVSGAHEARTRLRGLLMLSALGRVFRRDVSGDTARGVAVKNGNGNIAALLPPDVGGDDSVSPSLAAHEACKVFVFGGMSA